MDYLWTVPPRHYAEPWSQIAKSLRHYNTTPLQLRATALLVELSHDNGAREEEKGGSVSGACQ